MTIISEEIARLQHQIEFIISRIDQIIKLKNINIKDMADMQRYADTLEHLVNARDILLDKVGDWDG